MIKLVYGLHRAGGMSPDEFATYWRGRHAPLVAELAPALRIQRYVQTHALRSEIDAALAEPRGSLGMELDGMAELWFESEQDLTEPLQNQNGLRAAKALLEDERRFVDTSRSPIWLGREVPILS